MAMSVKRIKLKGQLLASRATARFRNGRLQMVVLCDLCGADAPMDLHELLIERDDANGNPEVLQLALESYQNVTLLCNKCNIGPAKEKQWRAFLIGKQISRAGNAWLKTNPTGLTGRPRDLLCIEKGSELLEEWLAALPMTDPKPYIRRVQNVAQDLMHQGAEKNAKTSS